MKKQISKILWSIFLIIFTISLSFTLVWCILHTQHNLPASRMVLLPVIFSLGIVGMFLFLSPLLNHWIQKHNSLLLFPFLLLYGILLFVICYKSRCIPVGDSACVYQGALYMAGLSNEINWAYFARCNNNIIPAVFLSLLFRLGSFLGLTDVYYAAVVINVLQVLAALYCVFRICEKHSHHSAVSAWLGMGMLACYFPLISHTQSLYTDAFSFSFAIVAYYIWSCNQEHTANKPRYYMVNLLCGILWGIGGSIKATVLISLFAVFIYLLLFQNWKSLLKNLMVLAGCLAIMSAFSHYTTTLPCESMRDIYGTPKISYFIGIGIEGDGRYTMESVYNTTIGSIAGMENKIAYSNQYIKENLGEFINPNHMLPKLLYNFASGGLGASDFMQKTEHPSFVYECISIYGKHLYRHYMLITGYYYMLLAMTVIACISRLFSKQAPTPHIAVPLLSMFGIMLYMMLCEANNRQLYNHLPWIICSASIGIWSIIHLIQKHFHK